MTKLQGIDKISIKKPDILGITHFFVKKNSKNGQNSYFSGELGK